MSDDYLWDKSGEPDPETERLEHLLGRFHYQPQPLNLPRSLPVTTSRRVLSPSLAAAAAVVLTALALGIWLSWQSGKKETAQSAVAIAKAKEERKEQAGATDKPQNEASEKLENA